MELTNQKRTIDENLLRLDLQYFAGEGEDGSESKGDPEGEPKDDPKSDPNDENPKPTDEDPETEPEDKKTFTQEDIDRIVKERLDREKRKRDEAIQKERDEAERKRLEEQGEYKELADKLQAELDAYKGDALKAKKEALLVKEGYSDEQVGVVSRLLEGETDEELKASLDEVKDAIAPKKTYVDPSAGNGAKQIPPKADGKEIGVKAFERIRGKLR